MTEKRFKIDYSDESIINTFTKQYYPTDDINGVEDICDLLNEQHETIQVLKASNGEMEDYLARLEEENEQLKQLLLQFYTEDEKECPLFDELDVLSNEMDMGFRVKLD